VFGTSGASETINMAYSIAANKARICFIGTPTTPVTFTAVEWELMNRREFTVTGSWMSYSAPFPGREWTLTAEMMGQDRLKFDERFIFQKYPLSQCAQAFASFQNPGQVKGKILLVNE
jgi:L-iditol 2-dehydrogenase